MYASSAQSYRATSDYDEFTPAPLDRLLRTLLGDYIVERDAERLWSKIPPSLFEMRGFDDFINQWRKDEAHHAELIFDMIKSALGEQGARAIAAHTVCSREAVEDNLLVGTRTDRLTFLAAFLYDEVFTRESYRIDAKSWAALGMESEASIISGIARDEGMHAAAVAQVIVDNAEALIERPEGNFHVSENLEQRSTQSSDRLISEKILGIVRELIDQDRQRKSCGQTVYTGLFLGDHDGYPDKLFERVFCQVEKILRAALKRHLQKAATE